MAEPRHKRYWERTVNFLQKRRMALMSQKDRSVYQSKIRAQAFATIAKDERWGCHLSGGGSTVEYTKVTREIVERVIRENGITSMVDVACGDFVWMPLVLERLPRSFRYIGCDIVPALIEQHRQTCPQYEFQVRDFVTDKIPNADLIFCRDVLQHLPVDDSLQALANFSLSPARYLLATTHLRRFGWRNGRDRRPGQTHDRNLLLKPFNLADPIVIYGEQAPGHKFLGLWELPLKHKNGRSLAT